MIKTLIAALLLIPGILGAQCVKEEAYRQDLRRNLWSLFEMEPGTSIFPVERIDAIPEKSGIYLKLLSEDRTFFEPLKKEPCPDRIIRLYHVVEVDEFKVCNSILRSDAVTLQHDLLYRHCNLKRSNR